VTVDGGFDYMRVLWDDKRHPMPEAFSLELPEGVTSQMLYDDWNHKTDEYGLIKTEES
jgi:hypothetical protein